VSNIVRLTLVSHAMTDAMSAGRFPGDESLNALGHRQIATFSDLEPVEHAVCGPEQRAVQTAELLGMRARIDPRLADLNVGRWRGDVLGAVDPADLSVWLTDATAAPHGGESIVELVARVGDWLESVTSSHTRVVAVTHPAVIRSAVLITLGAPAKSFWRIDIAPMSRTVMHFRGHSWTLRVT
jgi:broad specificity phosphatase PhoE